MAMEVVEAVYLPVERVTSMEHKSWAAKLRHKSIDIGIRR